MLYMIINGYPSGRARPCWVKCTLVKQGIDSDMKNESSFKENIVAGETFHY